MSTFTASDPLTFNPATDVLQGHRSGAAPVTPFTVSLAGLGYVSAATTSIFLDSNRVDTYTEDGTTDRPFKSIANAITYWTTPGSAAYQKALSANFAPGTYTTTGGGYTLPVYPLHIEGDGAVITGSSTYTISSDYAGYHINVVGNVIFASGSVSHHCFVYGGVITGNVTCQSGVVLHLEGVRIIGNITCNNGGTIYLGVGSSYTGSKVDPANGIYIVSSAPEGGYSANRAVITNSSGDLDVSVTTADELAQLSGVAGNVQTQLNTESATRLAADVRGIFCRVFDGTGYCYFATSAARSGWLDYGATPIWFGLVAGTGVGTLAEMGAVKIECTDPDAGVDNTRLQVSIVLDTGTLVVRTATRAIPMLRYAQVLLPIANVAGSISSASITAVVDGTVLTVANSGLEVVADYTGAPVAGTGAWTLMAGAGGTNPLKGRVAQWRALNYTLSSDEITDFVNSGSIPYECVGNMQLVDNGSFETFTGTADDGISDTAAGWTLNADDGAIAEIVTAPVGYALHLVRSPTNTSGGAMSTTPKYLRDTSTVIFSALCKGDGTYSGRWGLSMGQAYYTDTLGSGLASTGVTGSTWTRVTRTFIIPAGSPVYVLLVAANTSGAGCYFDDVSITVVGDVLAGLDLSAQPICSRTADGSVLSDTSTGICVTGPGRAPELMSAVSGGALFMDGSPFGSGVMAWPMGYSVVSVQAINTGTTSATLTLRASGASGAILATGTVAATGVPVPLTLTAANVSALYSTGGTFYLGGVAGTIIRLKIQLTKG